MASTSDCPVDSTNPRYISPLTWPTGRCVPHFLLKSEPMFDFSIFWFPLSNQSSHERFSLIFR